MSTLTLYKRVWDISSEIMSIFIHVAKLLALVIICDAMTMKQIKATGKTMRKSCQPKSDVTDEQIDPIANGVFVEDKEVMCYMACIMKMTGTLKGTKLNYDSAMKQADMLLPEEIKEPAKAAITGCKNAGNSYKDICEVAFHITKCIYNFNPQIFYFP